MPRVMVFRSNLLPGSETFIRNQVQAMMTWRPTLVGLTRTESAVSRPDDVILPRKPIGGRLHTVTGRSRQMVAHIREHGYAVVHAHFATDAWLVAASARKLGLPLVVTVHARDVTAALNDGPALKRWVMRYRVRSALRSASRVIAVSDFIVKKAIAAGADPARTSRVYTGTPIPLLEPVDKQWDVVFVGRLVEKKGVDDLFGALRLLNNPSLRVAVAGEGPLGERLREEARRMAGEVHFLGMVPPEEVAKQIAAARLVVVPSKSTANGDVEGLPTVLVEALALGIPVVATRHSGIPEAVESGVEGMLVAEGSPAELAEAIQQMLRDTSALGIYASNARKRAERDFDIRHQTQQLERIYESVVNAP